jgi:hypothetical protein
LAGVTLRTPWDKEEACVAPGGMADQVIAAMLGRPEGR